MAIVRWDPSRELNALQQQVDQVFSAFFDPATRNADHRAPWAPAVDLVEHDGEIVLLADLPGVSSEDLSIEVENDVLTLAGRRETRLPAEHGNALRLERAAGAFRRRFTLADGVDADAIRARFTDGVLEVRIPKPEAAKPRKVAIEVGAAPRAIEGTGEEREPLAAGAEHGD